MLRRVCRATSLAWVAALGCGQVLGIEDAHVDPSLTNPEGVGLSGDASHQHGGASPGGLSGLSSGGTRNSTGGQPIDTPDSTPEAGGGGEVAPNLCDQYCDALVGYCSGAQLQYRDREQCLAVCALLPEGVVGEPDGNTVACRLRYAGKARYAAGTELTAYCRQAGPGGDDRCGANCDGFCSIMTATCSRQTTDPYFFESEQACKTTCNGLEQVPYIYGDISLADSNTVQCRLFHVISAAMMDPEEHCEHAMGLTLCDPDDG